MKKLFLVVFILLNITIPIFANDIENFNLNNSKNAISNDEDIANVLNNLPLASEYNEYKNFGIDKLPDRMFYKLNIDCKYILNDNCELVIKTRTVNDYKIVKYICLNNELINLDDDIAGDTGPSSRTNAYLIKENGKIYLLIDKMFSNDARFYRVYALNDNKIELIEESSGRIDFVGYDYIIGYTDLGMIGYQRCEFKKVFRNGKFELDGEYKVIDEIYKLYTLTKDLGYGEYDVETKKYNNKVLKAGTKIRSLATDYKTYVKIETEDGKIGNVKIDNVKENGSCRDFYVNNQFFMNYYFLDGSKYSFEVFRDVPAY